MKALIVSLTLFLSSFIVAEGLSIDEIMASRDEIKNELVLILAQKHQLRNDQASDSFLEVQALETNIARTCEYDSVTGEENIQQCINKSLMQLLTETSEEVFMLTHKQ